MNHWPNWLPSSSAYGVKPHQQPHAFSMVSAWAPWTLCQGYRTSSIHHLWCGKKKASQELLYLISDHRFLSYSTKCHESNHYLVHLYDFALLNTNFWAPKMFSFPYENYSSPFSKMKKTKRAIHWTYPSNSSWISSNSCYLSRRPSLHRPSQIRHGFLLPAWLPDPREVWWRGWCWILVRRAPWN